MKYLILLFFFPIIAEAQIELFNTSLIDSTKGKLYAQHFNILKIYPYIQSSDIDIRSKYSRIIYRHSNTFTVDPTRSGLDTISIYHNNKLIYSKVFEVDTPPEPIVRVGNLIDTILHKNQILAQPYLRIFFPKTDYVTDYYIRQFEMKITEIGGELLLYEKSINNKFTAKQISTINKLKKGDKILFDGIVVMSAGSRARSVPAFTVIIK
jgi:hypothetical protein